MHRDQLFGGSGNKGLDLTAHKQEQMPAVSFAFFGQDGVHSSALVRAVSSFAGDQMV